MTERSKFGGIEVTEDQNCIEKITANEILERISYLFLQVADKLDNVRSPWDGDDVDGESAYFAVNAEVAFVILLLGRLFLVDLRDYDLKDF